MIKKFSKRNIIALISGGIDSPLAALIFSQKAKIIPLHFSHYPFYCEGSFKLAVDIIGNLQKIINFKKLIIYPFKEILQKLVLIKEFRPYICVVCRRIMFMIADEFCKIENAIGIVTGEVLGQKASQTLANFFITTHGIKHPIYKPLLCYDKNQIIAMAKEKGIWQEKHVGCCTITPTHPTTAGSLERVEKIIQDLNLLEIIQKQFSNVLVIKNFHDSNLELQLLSYLYSK